MYVTVNVLKVCNLQNRINTAKGSDGSISFSIVAQGVHVLLNY